MLLVDWTAQPTVSTNRRHVQLINVHRLTALISKELVRKAPSKDPAVHLDNLDRMGNKGKSIYV